MSLTRSLLAAVLLFGVCAGAGYQWRRGLPGPAAPLPTPSLSVCVFVGGDVGHSFSDRIVVGAERAAADLGCRLEIVRSAWDLQRMLQQLDEILARPLPPAIICLPGHAGEAALAPRLAAASEAGIIVTFFNIDVPQLRHQYKAQGCGFVGAQQHAAGELMAVSCLNYFALAAGDPVIVLRTQVHRGGERQQRAGSAIASLLAAGLQVTALQMPPEVELRGSFAEPGGADLLATVLASAASTRLVIVDSPGLAPPLAEALAEHFSKPPPVACFDLDAGVVAQMHRGGVQLAIDQLPMLQGYVPVVQGVLTHRYRISGLVIDTGGNVVVPATVHRLSRQVLAGVR